MKSNTKITTKDIVFIALFTAITAVAILIIKIPSGSNGYTHIGDGAIFLSVVLLGTKRGSISSGCGAALADLFAGYAHYAIPSLVIKFVMCYIMGYIMGKKINSKKRMILTISIASCFQILGYFLVGSFFSGNFVSEIPGIYTNILQSGVGMVICLLLSDKLKTLIEKY